MTLEVFGDGDLPVDNATNDALWRDKVLAQDYTLPTMSLPDAVQQAVATCFATAHSRADFYWLRAEFQVCDCV